MEKQNIRREITTSYYADISEAEEYTLRDKTLVHIIGYDAQGKRVDESWQDCDPNEETSLGNWGIMYEDGLERLKIKNGLSCGEYTHEQVAEDYRVVEYYGEDEQWIKEYNNEYLVYEERQEGPMATMDEYEYDEDGRMTLQKSASLDCEDSSGDYEYEVVEYTYQDGKLFKEICYRCESSSIEEFFNGDYTKNEDEIVRRYQYAESEELNGDERVVTVRKYDLTDNTPVKKTIRIYDNSHDRIIRKIELFLSGEQCVDETIYQY
jgi:hypothetical protein